MMLRMLLVMALVAGASGTSSSCDRLKEEQAGCTNPKTESKVDMSDVSADPALADLCPATKEALEAVGSAPWQDHEVMSKESLDLPNSIPSEGFQFQCTPDAYAAHSVLTDNQADYVCRRCPAFTRGGDRINADGCATGSFRCDAGGDERLLSVGGTFPFARAWDVSPDCPAGGPQLSRCEQCADGFAGQDPLADPSDKWLGYLCDKTRANFCNGNGDPHDGGPDGVYCVCDSGLGSVDEFCAQKRGLCGLADCPDGFAARYDAGLECEAHPCDMNGADKDLCCVVTQPCNSPDADFECYLLFGTWFEWDAAAVSAREGRFCKDYYCTQGVCCGDADSSPVCDDITDCQSGQKCEVDGQPTCEVCAAEKYGDQCDSDCPTPANASNGATATCTSASDVTLHGGCEAGFHLVPGGNGAGDQCESCAPIPNCAEHACASSATSVCTKCNDGRAGSQCQHSTDGDSACSGRGDVVIDLVEDDTSCDCDDGFSGDSCETAATCSALSVQHPAVVEAGSCVGGGAMDVAMCELGCADGFYQVGHNEGLCLAVKGDSTARYQGQSAGCSACTTIEGCDSSVTCSNSDDSQCGNCASGGGATCAICGPGKQQAADATRHRPCEQCPAGKFNELQGAAQCADCPAGKHAPRPGMRQCIACARGTFSDASGSETCTKCGKGGYSAPGSSTCHNCVDGEFATLNGCTSCNPVSNCVTDITCSTPSDSACQEGGCAKGFHIVNGYQCQACTTIDKCDLGATTCTGTTDHTCSACADGFYGPQCTECVQVEKCIASMTTCHSGPPTGTSDSVCVKCESGWEGQDCKTRTLNKTCFLSGHYTDDGTDVPEDNVVTAIDWQQCQWKCQSKKGKGTTSTTEGKDGELVKVNAKEHLGGCQLFSFNLETKECRLHGADAGCGADEACKSAAKKRVLTVDWKGPITADDAWIAGPKQCYRASCDELECPSGYSVIKEHMYRSGSRLQCSGQTCNREDDLDTCCNGATCGNWFCPHSHVAKSGVEGTVCSEVDGVATCDESDVDTCCDVRAFCLSLDCGVGFTHQSEGLHVSKKPCAGKACTLEADKGTCCEAFATCNIFDCPPAQKAVDADNKVRVIDFVSRPNGDQIYCHSKVCEVSEDRDTCCQQRGECASYTCPDGYASSTHAIRTQLACTGAVCNDDDDRDVCCFRQKSCSSMQSKGNGDVCPTGYAPKPDLNDLLCASGAGECDPRVDRDTCCDAQETCDEMGRELFDCAALNANHGGDCDAKCLKEKCQEQPSCAWTTGPPGMWFPLGALAHENEDNQPVGSGACGYRECHREWGGCVCPSGKDEWDEDEQMEGGFFKPNTGSTAASDWGWSGSSDDFEKTCTWQDDQICVDAADFTTHDKNGKATSILSGKKNCRDKHTAPMMSGLKASDKCPDDYVSKHKAFDTHCDGGSCTVARDRDTCCVARATCDTLIGHPAHHALKVDAASILCADSVCSAVDRTLASTVVIPSDVAACTDSRGDCSSMTCPAGSQHKAGKPLCASGACADSDADSCCEKCPSGQHSDGGSCIDCPANTFSAEGYETAGSSSCTECGEGKHSPGGMDHCLDCTAIFGCFSKQKSSSRRLKMALSAANSDSALSCTGPTTSTCATCVAGYFGSGTSKCTKCEPVKNCGDSGVTCTRANNSQCVECKEGFHGANCVACPAVVGCDEGGLSCDADGANSVCASCSVGAYSDGFGMCSNCAAISNCDTVQCTSNSDETCKYCASGFGVGVGGSCSKLTFDTRRGIWYV